MSGAAVAVLLASAFLLLSPGRWVAPLPGPFQRAGKQQQHGAGTGQRAGIEDPALMLDLVAAMLEAGQPLLPALDVLADVTGPGTSGCLRRVQAALELGAPWDAAWELAVAGHSGHPSGVSADPAANLREALRFVATTGAPSADVLVAEAAQIRRRRSREAERRAAALGVRLVVPLGLCALPAFVALTVVPLLLSLLPSFP